MDLTGLAAYWSMNENSGTRNDSYNSYPLTDSTTPTGVGSGKLGQAALFAGNTSQCLTNTNSVFGGATNDFTITSWVKIRDASAATQEILNRAVDSGLFDYEYELFFSGVTASNRFIFRVASGASGANATFVTANSYGAGQEDVWAFVVAWHDKTENTINIQVDNGPVDSVSYVFGSYTDGSHKLAIGAFGGENGGSGFRGSIDETSFWIRILTSSERRYLYNAGRGRSFTAINTGVGTKPIFTRLGGSRL